MSLTFLGLDELVVNRNNDRHGELTDEASAIRWLLDNREQHMKSLANDIATQKKIYEPPLVSKEHDKYLVFDGNRRVTCLKVLHEPRLAPTQSLRDFFYNLQKRHGGKFPNEIECKIENDRSTIDEILFRRHTGSQSGVGQSQWDDSAKHNFIVRTGQKPGKNVAEGIERKLLKTGHLASENTLPRSNLNRLLSSEEFRNQVGISLAGSKLYFTATPEKVLMALNRIASDLISKRLVLGHIWNNEGKRDYLSELKDQGLLP